MEIPNPEPAAVPEPPSAPETVPQPDAPRQDPIEPPQTEPDRGDEPPADNED
jgi:hypothetical protein